jgi:hypothetical protein
LNVETATRPGSTEQAFHANDFEEAPEYSSLSALAVISLLFGLAAPLCLVSKFFLIIPLVGAGLSLLALVRIAGSGGNLAGRGVAVAALVLCIVFGVAEVSRSAITRYLRTSEAEKVARDWLAVLVAGNVQEAFRLTVEGQRPPSMESAIEPRSPVSPLDEFKNTEVIKAILAAGKDAGIDFKNTEDYQRLSWRQFVVRQRFQIAPTASAETQSEPFDVDITTQRSHFQRETKSRWLVWKYEKPKDGNP